MMKYILLLFSFILVAACSSNKQEQKEKGTNSAEVNSPKLVPSFNPDSAYSYVKAQCDFGPRVPNTTAHVRCGDYLFSQLKKWCDTVYVQSGSLKAFDGTLLQFRNFIGVINPQAKDRVLLFAHWDTRPWADQDPVDSNKKKAALGADDGASGVGTLLELARMMCSAKPRIGVDIAFFDAEDWGKEGGGEGSEDSYALGTQYWAARPHVAGYRANYGILLDMVGAKNAQFRWEGSSKQYAGFVIEKVWSAAQQLGFGPYFLSMDGGWVVDDHVYVNKVNIPSIDIIHSDLSSRSGFAKHWHTMADNMDVIDRKTLQAVGQTLATVVYNE